MKELLYFTAEWCTPCKRVKPLLTEVLTEFPEISMRFVDAEEEREMLHYYAVMSVPTILDPATGKQVNPQANKDALRYLLREFRSAGE